MIYLTMFKIKNSHTILMVKQLIHKIVQEVWISNPSLTNFIQHCKWFATISTCMK